MHCYPFAPSLLLAVGILILTFGQGLAAPDADPARADAQETSDPRFYGSRLDDGCRPEPQTASDCDGDGTGNATDVGGPHAFRPLPITMPEPQPGSWEAPALGTQAANGCGGDHANAPNVICPISEPASDYIEHVRSTEEGVSIFLTVEGIDLGLSCRGAEQLVQLASELYSQIPAWERTHEDLLWANPNITREVFGHAVAADRGIPNGNPVDIVFEDYSPGSPSIQGAIWRGMLVDWVQILSCRPENRSG